MGLIIRWALNTLALLLVANVVPHFSYRSWVSLAIAAAVLGLLNAIVRPVLWFVTLPITVLTLGLFLLVLNAIMLELTDFSFRASRSTASAGPSSGRWCCR
jgi:putative membrane protein